MIGLKWTSYDYFTMHRIKELRGGDINVVNGPDECLLCGLSMGADGGIGATYNVMPKLFQKIYVSFRAGDLKAAQDAQFKANKLIGILLKFGVLTGSRNPLHAGYDCGYCTYQISAFTERRGVSAGAEEIRTKEESERERS
jgi:N-acetylneuraminate lyase